MLDDNITNSSGGLTLLNGENQRAYNLGPHDGFRAERTYRFTDGRTSQLNIDHKVSTDKEVGQHLVQLKTSVVGGTPPRTGEIKVNVTISAPEWCTDADVQTELDAVVDKTKLVLPRLRAYES